MKYSEIKQLIRWYKCRFNRKTLSDPYFQEWIDRYNSGMVTRFMDSYSLTLWKTYN